MPSNTPVINIHIYTRGYFNCKHWANATSRTQNEWEKIERTKKNDVNRLWSMCVCLIYICIQKWFGENRVPNTWKLKSFTFILSSISIKIDSVGIKRNDGKTNWSRIKIKQNEANGKKITTKNFAYIWKTLYLLESTAKLLLLLLFSCHCAQCLLSFFYFHLFFCALCLSISQFQVSSPI